MTLDLENGLDRLHRCIVHDARDWSLTKRDAITYALVVGWNDAWDHVARIHGWSAQDVIDLKREHAAIQNCKGLHK